MVRNIGYMEKKEILLIEDLLAETPPEKRCPYLVVDNTGPYCSKDLQGNEISEQRRLVCSSASLQLWCLDKSRVTKCIWYNGESFKE